MLCLLCILYIKEHSLSIVLCLYELYVCTNVNLVYATAWLNSRVWKWALSKEKTHNRVWCYTKIMMWHEREDESFYRRNGTRYRDRECLQRDFFHKYSIISPNKKNLHHINHYKNYLVIMFVSKNINHQSADIKILVNIDIFFYCTWCKCSPKLKYSWCIGVCFLFCFWSVGVGEWGGGVVTYVFKQVGITFFLSVSLFLSRQMAVVFSLVYMRCLQ